MRKPRVSDEQIIEELRRFYLEHGRSPSLRENPWPFSLAASRIPKRFGTWNNALTTAGLPITVTKHIPDAQILGELREYYERTGEKPNLWLTPWPFPLSKTRITERFGSWNNALRLAGVPIDRRSMAKEYSNEDLIKLLKDASERLGRTVGARDCSSVGIPSHDTFADRFGSWNDALRAAGLPVQNNASYTQEELLKIIKDKAHELGRTPTMLDFKTGQPNYSVFFHNFGTWNNALKLAGFKPNFQGDLAKAVIRMIAKFTSDEPIVEKTFDWLRNDKTNAHMRLDAYFPKNHFAVEFQGEQHYKPIDAFGGPSGTAEIQYRDSLKAKLCAENGLPLLVIKYDDDLTPQGIYKTTERFLSHLEHSA